MTAKAKEGIKVCLSKSNDPSLYLFLRSSQFTASRGFAFIYLYLFDHLNGISSLLIVQTPLSICEHNGRFHLSLLYLTCLTVLVIKFIFVCLSLSRGPVSLRVKDPVC